MGENCKNGWRFSRKMDGLRDMILPAKVCAHGYSIPMWEGHIMSNDLMMILEVMKEQSLFSLDSESRLHILRWPKTTTQRLKLPTEWGVSWSFPLANQWTSSMNFIHAVDGTEARGNSVNEEIDRDCIFSGQSPETLRRTATDYINQVPSTAAELLRSAQKYIDLLSRIWGSGICLSGSDFGDSPTPKKRRVRLAPKMVQTWVDLFRNSIQIFSFCSSIEPSSRFFKPFQLPLRTPSLGCASEGVGYRFPVLIHARQSGSRRSPRLWHTDSSRNSSAPQLLEGLMASTLKQILKENVGKGRLPNDNTWVYVKNSAQEFGYFHMAKLDEISKFVSKDARSMSKHLKEGKFSSGKACWISCMVKKCAADMNWTYFLHLSTVLLILETVAQTTKLLGTGFNRLATLASLVHPPGPQSLSSDFARTCLGLQNKTPP